MTSWLRPMPVGFPGLTTKNAFTSGFFKLLEFFVGRLEAIFLRRCDVYHLEGVVLQVSHLKVRREDRRAERDRIAGETATDWLSEI